MKNRIAIFYWKWREILWMFWYGRFVLTCCEVEEIKDHQFGDHKVFKQVSNTKYANITFNGSVFKQTLTWTEVSRGASVFTLIAGIIVCKRLRKQMPGKEISMVSVPDVAFINSVHGNENGY